MSPPDSPPSPWRQKLEGVFGLDTRSLAVFRVALAVLVLFDLWVRYQDLPALYTDQGVLPRALLPAADIPLTVHLLDGSQAYQEALFYVEALAALALLVGWQTRYATALVWLLSVSLAGRNPLAFHGGDKVMRLLLFWSIFLPLGACWSLDAMSRANPPRRVLSMGSVAYVWQLCLLYWFAALLKWDPAWRGEHYAVFMSLSISHFQTRLAQALLPHHELLQAMTWSALLQEGFVPLLILVPWRTWAFRLFAVASFAAFHVGLGLCLTLGIFPAACIIAWLPLLPTEFWDWLAARLRRPARAGLVLALDPQDGPAWEAVRFWTTVLLLRDVPVRSGREAAQKPERVQSEGGWVAVDARGKAHARGDALLLLLRASPAFWPLAPLPRLAPAPFRDWLAGGRRARPGEQVPPPRPDRPPLVAPLGGLTNVLLAALMVYIFAMNVVTWTEPRNGQAAPRSFNPAVTWESNSPAWDAVLAARNAVQDHLPAQTRGLGNLLALDQDWNLFAPYPTVAHGWLLPVGQLEDGRMVNLLDYAWNNAETPVDLNEPRRPELVADMYPNTVWKKYCIGLLDVAPPNYAVRQHFLAWLCELWDANHPDSRLKAAALYWKKETTQPDYREPTRETVRLCRLNCRGADLRKPGAADLRVVSLDRVGSLGVTYLVGQGLGWQAAEAGGAALGPLTQAAVAIKQAEIDTLP